MPIVIALYSCEMFGPRSVGIVVFVPTSFEVVMLANIILCSLYSGFPGKLLENNYVLVFFNPDSFLVFPREQRGML